MTLINLGKFALVSLAGLAVLYAAAAQTTAPNTRMQTQDITSKVVYHINDADTQALGALRNLRNHLDVAPKTTIIVVSHATGVDFLMEGAKHEKTGTAYAPLVSALTARGVRFEVCEITLKNRNLRKDQFVMEAEFTPSGVVRIADLQTQQGFAYLKP